MNDTLQVRKNEQIIIKSLAYGTPQPSIIWKKDSNELTSNDRICMDSPSTEEDNTTYILTILNVQPEDQGIYSAQYTNVFGLIESKQCKVTVIREAIL